MPNDGGAQGDEIQLRAWLAKQLGTDDVPEDEWEELVNDDWVGEVLSAWDEEQRATARAELIDRAKFIREWKRRRAGKRTGPSAKRLVEGPTKMIPLSENEEERARWVSNALGQEASALPPVRSFRARWLDEGLLDVEDARAVMDAIDDRLVAEDESARALVELTAWLKVRYPWDLTDIGIFILSGIPPWIEPIRAYTEVTDYSSNVHGRVVLEIEPWVSKDTVERAYRSLQAWLLNKDNRPVEDRGLTAFAHVLSRVDHNQQPIESWEAIYQAWQDGPGMRYPMPNKYKLKRAYENARSRMLTPEYTNLRGSPVARGQPRRERYRNVPHALVSADPAEALDGEDV